MDNLLSRLIIVATILLVGMPVLFGVVAYVWNKKYVPSQLAKGKVVRSFGKWMSEIHKFTFKEDTATLAKKAPPVAQKILSLRAIHIILGTVGVVGTVLTGNWFFLLTLPVSFCLGVGRAVPIILSRQKVLDRIFAIASSSIRFSTGARGKNVAPPASWNHITVEKWKEDVPMKMVITFPPGAGPEQGAQKSFEKSFEAMVTDENIWVYEWDLPHDKVTIEATPHLPTQLPYPGSEKAKWSVFPVGESAGGVASYDVSVFPHVLVGGPSGTGKSVLQRNIVFHTIQHNDRWRFLGIDLKRVELTPYNKYKKTVMGIATDVEQGLEVLKYAYNEMMDRYTLMESIGVNNVMDMPDPPYCILLMIDEATMFLGASGSKTEEGKAEDAMKAEAADLVGKILRLGRASGIHMLVAMQRPDATVLRGEFKANMDVRLAAGRMDSTPSSMILDSGEAVNLPGIKGRGLIRVGGNLTVFQGYFAPQDWIDDYILKHPEVEPSCVAPGGHLYEKYQAMVAMNNSSSVEASDDSDSPSGVVEEAPKALPVAMPELVTTAEELPESQRVLLDALNKKPEDSVPDASQRTVPSFFTGTATKEPVEELVSRKEIEPELADKDYLLDDFEDLDSILQSPAEPEPTVPVSPAPAEPEVKWKPVSPFASSAVAPAREVPASEPQKPAPTVTAPKPATPFKPVASPFNPVQKRNS